MVAGEPQAQGRRRGSWFVIRGWWLVNFKAVPSQMSQSSQWSQ